MEAFVLTFASTFLILHATTSELPVPAINVVPARISHIDAVSPFSPALIDTFRRRHDYLRISLTERCNLRCFYCMPEEGTELSPESHLLTNEEVLRLAALFVKSGVTKIRLTGGEPTVRKGLNEIIAGLNGLRPYGLRSIAMTTNGLVLSRRLPAFIDRGLTHLNISLDTLDPYKFEFMTRRRGHEYVLKALDVALVSQALVSVKLNVVVVKGLNDSEVLDFIEMTKERVLSVRFIEFMPFTGNAWDKRKMVPSNVLLDKIILRHPDVQRISDEVNDTARSWRVPGYKGNFGFISSMSDHFCSSCNRLRITADGQIKVCLFDAKEISLRDAMRNGATDGQLLQAIGKAVSGKQEKHANMEDIDVITNRPMILIGVDKSLMSLTMFLMSYPLLGPSAFSFSCLSSSKINLKPHGLRCRHYSLAASASAPCLTHLNDSGRANMVDVSLKEVTRRIATASGRIFIPLIAYELLASTYPDGEEPSTALEKAKQKVHRKGDTLTIAQLAAIMGSKKTSDLIPLCHPLQLSNVSVTLTLEAPAHDSQRHSVLCRATVSCDAKTGVEMEALTAVSVGLLTVWDMLKAVAGKEMEIGEIVVTEKSGGKSGDFVRNR
ncbi:molybdenum cofactor biosynthesis prote [Guyanagaster necrorhizus]|uniref:Molybdenum cofactor biosynthesis prote n=1 Tax=Guyanagaster necrorhizus TaxID=856835 RepID=A0A9P8AZS3_9AGAR|nr:molybdenum cofactor biosynthesis prote [Guyanagaster necrorhizus MCA 3950]KAG7452242.1 molybdenum cofactor biosynthesis prote [Guyanagaster necrorhizus MCA 3950]